MPSDSLDIMYSKKLSIMTISFYSILDINHFIDIISFLFFLINIYEPIIKHAEYLSYVLLI